MSNVEDIEKAVESLTPAELAKFRAWFEAFEAKLFDDVIEADAVSNRLDRLAEAALKDHNSGRATLL